MYKIRPNTFKFMRLTNKYFEIIGMSNLDFNVLKFLKEKLEILFYSE